MICPSCHTINDDEALFCVNCGARIAGAQPEPQNSNPAFEPMPIPMNNGGFESVGNPAPAAGEPGKGMAIASLVLSIVAFLCFPYITSILAIIFGAVSKSKGYQGGIATAGLICGVIALVLEIVLSIAR